jgi:hypothetical protein
MRYSVQSDFIRPNSQRVTTPSRMLKNSFPPQFDSVPDSLGFRCVPGFDRAPADFFNSLLEIGHVVIHGRDLLGWFMVINHASSIL